MQLKLRTLVMGVAGTLSGLVMTGCNSDSPEPDPVAYVSIYHTSPDAGDLDVYDNSQKINTQAFKYGAYSGYVGFGVGLHELKFTEAGAGASASLLTEAVNFEQDKFYSFFIANEAIAMQAVITEDDPTPPAAGNVMVRFIHMSPDTDVVDFGLTGEAEPLYSDFSFGDTMDFDEMTAGTYTFEAWNAADEVLASEASVELKAGSYYTIILQGYTDPEETNKLEFNVIEN